MASIKQLPNLTGHGCLIPLWSIDLTFVSASYISRFYRRVFPGLETVLLLRELNLSYVLLLMLHDGINHLAGNYVGVRSTVFALVPVG